MERDYYFDNVKGALITLVVIGHFLLPMERTRFVGSLIHVIYLFHMPGFAMVSGYFAKNIYRAGKYRTDKVLRLAWLYILFKIAVHVTENLAAGKPVTGRIDFFGEEGAPWYFMAMIWWYFSVPCAAGLKPRVVMGICLCLGILGGYQDFVGDALVMSRTLTFAPFFYGGYYLTREDVQKFLGSRWRWISVASAIGIAAITALGTGRFLNPYVRIVYGMNYRILSPEAYQWGGLIRLVCYLWGTVMICGLLAVTPRSRQWWTVLGQRTLQIYVLHRLLRDMMRYWGFYEIFTSKCKSTVAFVTALAVAVTFGLAQRRITRGFEKIQKVPQILYETWRAD